jgi:carbon storage regulator
VLVLSRKRDEKILLRMGQEDVELTVVRIDANKVRLGIQASDNVTILRSELIDKAADKQEVAV